MKDKLDYFVSLRILIILTVVTTAVTFMMVPDTARAQGNAVNGEKIYTEYCIGCHGAKHDGKGNAAANLLIKPRDLTLGVFKFKTTAIGALPTDEDLKKTLTYGLSPSSMPSFRLVPDAEKDDLVAYIKTLSDKWKTNYATKQYLTPAIPDFVGTKASIEQGKNIYAQKCYLCHGKDGVRQNVIFHLRWNDENSADITRPADFTYKSIKRGPKVEDIYLSITTGVEGTPMLSFNETLSDNDRWNLTSYVLSIMGKERR